MSNNFYYIYKYGASADNTRYLANGGQGSSIDASHQVVSNTALGAILDSFDFGDGGSDTPLDFLFNKDASHSDNSFNTDGFDEFYLEYKNATGSDLLSYLNGYCDTTTAVLGDMKNYNDGSGDHYTNYTTDYEDFAFFQTYDGDLYRFTEEGGFGTHNMDYEDLEDQMEKYENWRIDQMLPNPSGVGAAQYEMGMFDLANVGLDWTTVDASLSTDSEKEIFYQRVIDQTVDELKDLRSMTISRENEQMMIREIEEKQLALKALDDELFGFQATSQTFSTDYYEYTFDPSNVNATLTSTLNSTAISNGSNATFVSTMLNSLSDITTNMITDVYAAGADVTLVSNLQDTLATNVATYIETMDGTDASLPAAMRMTAGQWAVSSNDPCLTNVDSFGNMNTADDGSGTAFSTDFNNAIAAKSVSQVTTVLTNATSGSYYYDTSTGNYATLSLNGASVSDVANFYVKAGMKTDFAADMAQDVANATSIGSTVIANTSTETNSMPNITERTEDTQYLASSDIEITFSSNYDFVQRYKAEHSGSWFGTKVLGLVSVKDPGATDIAYEIINALSASHNVSVTAAEGDAAAVEAALIAAANLSQNDHDRWPEALDWYDTVDYNKNGDDGRTATLNNCDDDLYNAIVRAMNNAANVNKVYDTENALQIRHIKDGDTIVRANSLHLDDLASGNTYIKMGEDTFRINSSGAKTNVDFDYNSTAHTMTTTTSGVTATKLDVVDVATNAAGEFSLEFASGQTSKTISIGDELFTISNPGGAAKSVDYYYNAMTQTLTDESGSGTTGTALSETATPPDSLAVELSNYMLSEINGDGTNNLNVIDNSTISDYLAEVTSAILENYWIENFNKTDSPSFYEYFDLHFEEYLNPDHTDGIVSHYIYENDTKDGGFEAIKVDLDFGKDSEYNIKSAITDSLAFAQIASKMEERTRLEMEIFEMTTALDVAKNVYNKEYILRMAMLSEMEEKLVLQNGSPLDISFDALTEGMFEVGCPENNNPYWAEYFPWFKGMYGNMPDGATVDDMFDEDGNLNSALMAGSGGMVDPYIANINGVDYVMGIDKDKNGVINEAEEILGITDTKENLFESMYALDSDQDGYVSQEELKANNIIFDAVNMDHRFNNATISTDFVRGIDLSTLKEADGTNNVFGDFQVELTNGRKADAVQTFQSQNYFNNLFGTYVDLSFVEEAQKSADEVIQEVAKEVQETETTGVVAQKYEEISEQAKNIFAAEEVEETEESEETEEITNTLEETEESTNIENYKLIDNGEEVTIANLIDQLLWEKGISRLTSTQRYDILGSIDVSQDFDIIERKIEQKLDTFQFSA